MDYTRGAVRPEGREPDVLVKAHEVNGDSAQGYLKTHDAGTGPYTITGFDIGIKYTLSAFNDYWGGAPDVEGDHHG